MSSEIDALIAAINKKMKGDVLVRGCDLHNITYQRATTGSLAFDLMLGGGWPLNSWNEIIGNESSGKTSMVLKTIAAQQALKPDYHTLWVASEEFNFEWAAALGVDVERITFVTTNVMEIVYDVVLTVLEERATDAVVIDSYPALVPSEEDDKTMTELTVGRGAYLTNKFMRKSYAALARSLSEADRPVLALFINQWRERIGVMGHADPRITPGGKGKNYSFLTRVDVAREEWILDGKIKIGQRIKAKTVKNKTAPPQRVASVDFYFQTGKGFIPGEYDSLTQVHALAMSLDIVTRRGAFYYYGERKWQGEAALEASMKSDPLLTAALTAEVRHVFLGEPLPVVEPQPKRKRVIKA